MGSEESHTTAQNWKPLQPFLLRYQSALRLRRKSFYDRWKLGSLFWTPDEKAVRVMAPCSLHTHTHTHTHTKSLSLSLSPPAVKVMIMAFRNCERSDFPWGDADRNKTQMHISAHWKKCGSISIVFGLTRTYAKCCFSMMMQGLTPASRLSTLSHNLDRWCYCIHSAALT